MLKNILIGCAVITASTAQANADALKQEVTPKPLEICEKLGKPYHDSLISSVKKNTPASTKKIIHLGMNYAHCLEKAESAFDYGAVTVYGILQATFKSTEASDRLKEIQNLSLKEASYIKDHTAADFAQPTPKTDNACKYAEFGYNIGYVGKDGKQTDEKENVSFINNGIYYATCIALNPNFQIEDEQFSIQHAHTILYSLANEYGSKFAAQLIEQNK